LDATKRAKRAKSVRLLLSSKHLGGPGAFFQSGLMASITSITASNSDTRA
jgi:hypothetical protein